MNEIQNFPAGTNKFKKKSRCRQKWEHTFSILLGKPALSVFLRREGMDIYEMLNKPELSIAEQKAILCHPLFRHIVVEKRREKVMQRLLNLALSGYTESQVNQALKCFHEVGKGSAEDVLKCAL